ncbi:CRISPR-associated protein Cas1 [Candidatus Magnetomorum sp. HK-1]|nr:CRISPR-associated protein Cas1 [Candidatus Magnetomorum sp. HK-1]
MSEFVVYIDQNDVQLSIDHNTLRIKSQGKQPKTLPIGMIGQIVIYNRTDLSTNLLSELVKRKISIVIISGFGREQIPAWIGPGLSNSVMSRLSQHQAYSDEQKKIKTAAWFIEKKIDNYLSLLKYLTKLIKNESTEHIFKKSLRKSKLIKKIDNTASIMFSSLEVLATCDSVESIRGYEGNAASAWFTFLSDVLKKEWRFSGRNKRPPKDPINALLSLTYTLILSEMKIVVNERGLDPCIGFLHTPHPGRESFVIDMLEPIRPGADAFVFSLLDDKLFTESDFTTNKQYGCRLNKDARGKYYLSWADWRTNWPDWNSYDSDAGSIDEKNLRTVSRNLIDQVVTLWS